jgi:hypothetical protein
MQAMTCGGVHAGASRQAESAAQQALLVIAHPGHELRLYGWLHSVHADVVILTTGAGRCGGSRTDSSRRVLDEVGATPSSIFGRYSDLEIYSAFLNGQNRLFMELAADLASILRSKPYTAVVADPFEGHNPTHDVCRVLVEAALERVAARTGRVIPHYEYPLINNHIPVSGDDDIHVCLDENELTKKIHAAFSYPELAAEVSMRLQLEGVSQQAKELLRRISRQSPSYSLPTEPPFYHYPAVLRYREHFVPVSRALMQWAHKEFCEG